MTHSGSDLLHFRLFAKLILFVALFLGGVVGYYVGFDNGEQHAKELLEAGRLSEETLVNSDVILSKKRQQMLSEAVQCYQQKLGSERYTAFVTGDDLTAEDVFAIMPCEQASKN